MDCVVLIPGIMGSELQTPTGDVIWPPTAWEVMTGYGRLAEIMRDDLVSTDIVRKVSCANVYKPLIDQIRDIGFTETGAAKRLEIFHYDWRLDLERTAQALSDRLDALVAAGASSLTIVAHSMGGLVTRLAVEPDTFRGMSWHPKLKGVFTLGTPHLGAPVAYVRILGLEGQIGISGADFATFAADPRFPAAYQLLPAPGEAAVWDAGDPTIGPIDIYDPAGAGRVGLDPALVARTRWVHHTLAGGSKPDHVRYFYFGGGGHKTVTRLNVGAGALAPTETTDSGDGTVPMWSAFGGATQKQLVMGEHSKFFRYDAFAAVLYRLFGVSYVVPPTRAAGALDLSVQGLTLRTDEKIELLMLSPVKVGKIEGELTLSVTHDPDTTPFAPMGGPIRVAYDGPPVDRLLLELPATGRPGHFQVGFAGTPKMDEPAQFSVCEVV